MMRSGITKKTPFSEDCVRQSIERVAFAFSWREFIEELNTASCHKESFQSPGDSLPLWSMQHAIMTLNNPSGVEIMTAETLAMSR